MPPEKFGRLPQRGTLLEKTFRRVCDTGSPAGFLKESSSLRSSPNFFGQPHQAGALLENARLEAQIGEHHDRLRVVSGHIFRPITSPKTMTFVVPERRRYLAHKTVPFETH